LSGRNALTNSEALPQTKARKVQDPAGFFDHQGVLMTDTSDRDELVRQSACRCVWPEKNRRSRKDRERLLNNSLLFAHLAFLALLLGRS
jgi:hypothetical protein